MHKPKHPDPRARPQNVSSIYTCETDGDMRGHTCRYISSNCFIVYLDAHAGDVGGSTFRSHVLSLDIS